eukprot:5713346-Amphidinium_carterae.1
MKRGTSNMNDIVRLPTAPSGQDTRNGDGLVHLRRDEADSVTQNVEGPNVGEVDALFHKFGRANVLRRVVAGGLAGDALPGHSELYGRGHCFQEKGRT